MTETATSTTEITEEVVEQTTSLLDQGETTETTETVESEDFEALVYPEDTIIDEGLQAEFKASAKEAGLTLAQAQRLTDLGAKMQTQLMARHQAAQAELYQGWAESSKADKEFGGDKLNENLAIASKAIDAFATPELKELLNTSGLGNHPEMIRAFYRAGKAMSEDNLISGGKAPVGDKSLADRLYSKS